MDSGRTRTKPCHNCRYHKLRCDRSIPACRKCTAAGRECLGYGKLYRWADAVATRGKLAGRTKPVLASANEPATKPRCTATRNAVISANRALHVTHSLTSQSHSPGRLTIPWAMVDPLFDNVNSAERRYMSYFTTRVCAELVAIDMPDYNPFRLFIPLSSACQLLRHIIITASAAHMSNVLDPPSNVVPSHILGTRQHTSEASRRALEDALSAKQQALQLLRLEIQNSSPVVSDTLLIAVQFLIAVELIESGKHGWKAHLEGTGRILGQLPPIDGDYKVLRDFIISDCYICYIFASTFTKELIRSSSYSHTAQCSSVIRYAAHNSYICCPAEILQILLAVAQLSNEEVDDDASKNRVTEEGIKLMTDAMSLDLHAWANNIETIPRGRQVTELESRTHAGLAHQRACCLYILYAVPSIRDFLPPDIEETLERDLTVHLLAISDEDPNFKTAFWPTFVAGAQARDPDRRASMMARMQRQAVLFPWGFVYTAIDTLRFIWDQESDGRSKRNWLQILQDPDVNFLLV